MRLSWLVVLGVCVIGGIIGLMGMSQSTAYAASIPFSRVISDAFTNADEFYRVVDRGNGLTVEYDTRYEINMDWWKEVGRDQLLSQRGFFDDMDLIVLTDWLWFLLIAPTVGVLFRVLFSQSHVIIQAVLFVSSLAIAALLTWLVVTMPSRFLYLGYYVPSDALGTATAGLPIAWLTFFIGTVSYVLAFIAADPMLRLIHRVVPMLPEMTGREPKGMNDY